MDVSGSERRGPLEHSRCFGRPAAGLQSTLVVDCEAGEVIAFGATAPQLPVELWRAGAPPAPAVELAADKSLGPRAGHFLVVASLESADAHIWSPAGREDLADEHRECGGGTFTVYGDF